MNGGSIMQASTVMTVLNVTRLVAIMLSMGMKVRLEALLASARQTRLAVLGPARQFRDRAGGHGRLALPFPDQPAVSVGFLILAVCPGAPFAPLITAIARGHVPSAIGMMLILAGLSAFLSPALLAVLMSWIAPESGLRINTMAVVRTLLITQLLPLALGMAIHHATPNLTRWAVKPVSVLANVLLLASDRADPGDSVRVARRDPVRGWIGMSLLLLASMGIGWVMRGLRYTNPEGHGRRHGNSQHCRGTRDRHKQLRGHSGSHRRGCLRPHVHPGSPCLRRSAELGMALNASRALNAHGPFPAPAHFWRW